MRRWHSVEEHRIMFRRWKEEMEQHRYDWRNPPTDPNACHCAKGIGSMRKQKPARTCHCSWCMPKLRRRQTELHNTLRFEYNAEGGW